MLVNLIPPLSSCVNRMASGGGVNSYPFPSLREWQPSRQRGEEAPGKPKAVGEDVPLAFIVRKGQDDFVLRSKARPLGRSFLCPLNSQFDPMPRFINE